jgi:hypothetical protein
MSTATNPGMNPDLADLRKICRAYQDMESELVKEEARYKAEYESIQQRINSPLCTGSYLKPLCEQAEKALRELERIAADLSSVGINIEKVASAHLRLKSGENYKN